jgi:hypothetical protein
MTNQLKRGVLPYAGGWMAQPFHLSEALVFAQRLIQREERGQLGSISQVFQILGM